MKFEPGVIVIAAAILLFYGRMAMIRGRKRKEERQELIAHLHSKRKGRGTLAQGAVRPNYEIGNYYVLALGAVLMLMGMAARTMNIFPAIYTQYWWAVVAVGVVVFMFGIK